MTARPLPCLPHRGVLARPGPRLATPLRPGIADNWFRAYDPYTGAYLQADPIYGPASILGTPAQTASYGYVGNNPLRYVDPFGLDPIIPASPGPFGQVDFQTETNWWLDNTLYGVANILANTSGMVANAILGPIEQVMSLVPQDVVDGIMYSPTLGAPAQMLEGAAAGLRNACSARRGAPIAGKIAGFTKHGLDQAITRGVKPGSILDAVKTPLQLKDAVIDSLGHPSQRYIGREAEVVLNPQPGQVVSVNPTSSDKAARLLGDK
jgi:RHS repeat-associated protein